MRVLILSCNTGEGHNSCSAAIQEGFEAQGVHCEVTDALRFISKGASQLFAKAHVAMYRHFPGLFRHGYSFLENHPGVFRQKTPVHRFLTVGAERLGSFVSDGKFDAVICTHVLSALILTEALRRDPLPVRTAFVATDYTCSPSMDQSALDLYFIPDAALASEFLVGGVRAEQMIPSGIPVRSEFYRCSDRAAAGAAFGIPEGHRHMMMMCGSMGCGPIRQLTRLLAQKLTPEQHLSVLCGTNKRLFQQMKRRYADHKNIHIYDYVPDISLLMDSVDLYLTKPGGLSTTEAAVKCLPMVMIDAVAGCEAHNRRYFLNTGLGVTADSPRALAEKCAELLSDPERTRALRAAGERHRPAVAAERICEEMIDLCGARTNAGRSA